MPSPQALQVTPPFLSDCYHVVSHWKSVFATVRPLLSCPLSCLAFTRPRRTLITLQYNLACPTATDNNLNYSQYTVTATCTGGPDGSVSSTPTDDTVPFNLKLATPKAFGGSGDSGHNPDQLLAVDYSGMLNQYRYLCTDISMNNNISKTHSVLLVCNPKRFDQARQERSRGAGCCTCRC